jgi:hypothetical protein
MRVRVFVILILYALVSGRISQSIFHVPALFGLFLEACRAAVWFRARWGRRIRWFTCLLTNVHIFGGVLSWLACLAFCRRGRSTPFFSWRCIPESEHAVCNGRRQGVSVVRYPGSAFSSSRSGFSVISWSRSRHSSPVEVFHARVVVQSVSYRALLGVCLFGQSGHHEGGTSVLLSHGYLCYYISVYIAPNA